MDRFLRKKCHPEPECHPEPAAGLSSESSCALEPAERTAGGPSESLQLPDVEVSSCSSTDGEQQPDFSCCDEPNRTWLRSEQASQLGQYLAHRARSVLRGI